MEGDRGKAVFFLTPFQFLSTPSGWRATPSSITHSVPLLFLSTPSGWRATGSGCYEPLRARISIHALRVEGDGKPVFTGFKLHEFLSTPSGWRATVDHLLTHKVNVDFYPRPPGGGRPIWLLFIARYAANFYPRPPGGGRLLRLLLSSCTAYFYPRPPGGGRL